MDKRTTGIILTIATVLLCGCPGLIVVFAGALTALISFIPGAEIDIFGRSDPQAALNTGLGALCLGLIFIAIPVVVGIITLRSRGPRPVSPGYDEPLPPTH